MKPLQRLLTVLTHAIQKLFSRFSGRTEGLWPWSRAGSHGWVCESNVDTPLLELEFRAYRTPGCDVWIKSRWVWAPAGPGDSFFSGQIQLPTQLESEVAAPRIHRALCKVTHSFLLSTCLAKTYLKGETLLAMQKHKRPPGRMRLPRWPRARLQLWPKQERNSCQEAFHPCRSHQL